MNVRRHVLSAAAAAALLGLAGCGMMSGSSSASKPASGSMMSNSMTIPLSAANQVPPNASAGSGTAKVELEGMVLRWSVTYSGLTGPVTAAHFHGPAPAGGNGPVVLPFTAPLTSPINGTASVTDKQIADIKAGLWYINLHTAANPGGEIRGQVK